MNWRFSMLFLLLLCFDGPGIKCQEDGESLPRNEVLGEPTVSCAADAIYVKLRTKSTFLGHVDVKYTPDKSCFQSLVTNNQIEILIPHEECMVPRRRSLHPTGVILEVSLSVSFHPEFTTSDDRIFNMQCFHQKKSNGTSSSLAIGSPQPPPSDTKGPSCSYEVLSNPGGQPAGRLALGQEVYHSWQCQNVYESCIMIDSCELVGGEETHEVIDSSGCSKHESIMPQLEYHNRTHVGASVKVFGVSHTSIVYFACQIRLHPQLPTGECPKPKCDLMRKKRDDSTSQFPSIDVRSQNLEISQLINATMSSLDSSSSNPTIQNSCPDIHVESAPAEEEEEASESKLIEEERICADFRSVLIISILLTMALILITTTIVVLIVRRQKYEIASMS
uniref:ZP domain-containing protein n=2 Tax=Caenorhabditis tropicalis TaxID=1561998 RepID=A0A1I7UYU5_9PELO